jgi:3-methylfumaryl-CoA hydratase
MWAGSRIEWHRPLEVGALATRHSRIESVTPKRGKSGDLVFVVVRYEISVGNNPALTEEHDIVYRDLSPADAPRRDAAPAPPAALWTRRIVPDDVLLFRYSALTFNGHRIHYDRRYVTEVEGYPGLVVHGPLLATLLVDLVRRHRPDAVLRRFEFRAKSPLFDTAPFDVCGRPEQDGRVSLWAQGPGAAIAMSAEATLA